MNVTRREPPTCKAWDDRLIILCDIYPVTFKKPIPPGVPCHYCGNESSTRDHIVPDAVGGVRTWWNLVPACWECNRDKADRQACSCLYCMRAMALWHLGYRHNRLTRQEREKGRKHRNRGLG